MKRCPTCGETKVLADFPPDARNRDGASSICRLCACAATRRWRDANPGYDRTAENAAYYERNHDDIRSRQVELRLISRYGITSADFEMMLERQGGRCAICRTDKPGGRGSRFQVDHNHETGEVRGLLCWACNVRLGVLENLEFRVAADAYLTRDQVNQ